MATSAITAVTAESLMRMLPHRRPPAGDGPQSTAISWTSTVRPCRPSQSTCCRSPGLHGWRSGAGSRCAADYVAQAVLAAAAGVSGTRVRSASRRAGSSRCASGWPWSARPRPAIAGAGDGLAPRGAASARADRRPPRQISADPRERAHGRGCRRSAASGLHGKLLWRDDANGCFAPVKGMTNLPQLRMVRCQPAELDRTRSGGRRDAA